MKYEPGKPSWSILDKANRGRYKNSVETDLHKVFSRIRWEQQQAKRNAEAEAEAKVTSITTRRTHGA